MATDTKRQLKKDLQLHRDRERNQNTFFRVNTSIKSELDSEYLLVYPRRRSGSGFGGYLDASEAQDKMYTRVKTVLNLLQSNGVCYT